MIKTLFLVLTFTAASLVSGRADTVNLSGDTTGAPTFLRPTETGARSFFNVPYNVYQFNVSVSGQFTFTLTAADPANYDTYLHLFANSFDPNDLSDPATNFLAGNDDRVLGRPDLGSGLTNFTLNAGQTYFFVVDGFFPTDAGAYTATITGPGVINIVPEPASTTLVILSGLGLAFVARRQLRSARA